jgi:hypothetical protein
MPVYTLPSFNITANVWSGELQGLQARWTFRPPIRAADFSVGCQLYVQQRVFGALVSLPYREFGNAISIYGARLDLRVPKGTSIRYPLPNSQDGSSDFDVVEVPAASGRYYYVPFATPVHSGFINEYLMAVLLPYVFVGQAEDAVYELHDSFAVSFGALV